MAIHEIVLARHGGKAGLRDLTMLETAVAKPRNLRAYRRPQLSDLAAAYAVGVISTCPFIGGNKRTGLVAAATFLELNGYEFTATEVDAVVQTLALAAGELDEAGFAAWLKRNSRRARRGKR